MFRNLQPQSGAQAVRVSYAGATSIEAGVAKHFSQRLTGLLAGPPRALFFPSCNALHTLGMRYAIDVWFLTSASVVCRTLRLAPWRMCACVAASAALELPADLYPWPMVGERLKLAPL